MTAAVASPRLRDPLEASALQLADGLWELIPDELPVRHDGRPITRLSASSITAFALCPEAFRRRYLQGERHPATPALLIGRAVDATYTAYYRQIIDGGGHLHGDALDDLFNEQFARELAAAIDGDGVRFEDGPSREQCFDAARALVHVMREQIVPLVGRPLSVQRRFAFKLAPHLNWSIVGTLDLESEYRLVRCFDEDGELLAEWSGEQPEPTIERDAEGPLRSARHRARPKADVPISALAARTVEQHVVGIDDVKAKDRPIDAVKGQLDIQAGLYLTQAWLAGEPRDRFRWLQGLKPGAQRQAATTKVVATTRSDAEMRALLVRIAEVAAHLNDLYRTRGPDRLWPLAPAGSWKCTARFCDHFRQRTCPMAGL